MDMRSLIALVEGLSGPPMPSTLAALSNKIKGKGWEAAKRFIVAKVGSVAPGERFDDEVADAVFARIQRNSQIGRYASEEEVDRLGRNARRLDGDAMMTLYRAAPKGGGIRPGDFCASTADEAGYYLHGGHVMQTKAVPAHDVIAVDGTLGNGQEYVYLPLGHVAEQPHEFFATFREFYDAAQ